MGGEGYNGKKARNEKLQRINIYMRGGWLSETVIIYK
jgi:hypothetical protein